MTDRDHQTARAAQGGSARKGAMPSGSRRVPMAGGPAGGVVERPRNFGSTMARLLGYIGEHRLALFAGIALAIGSVVFNIVGPKVLGQVTTKLFEGIVAKVQGTGDVTSPGSAGRSSPCSGSTSPARRAASSRAGS